MYKQLADLWIDLMFWWVPKERQPLVADEASVVSSETAVREAPAQEEEHLGPPADLTIIKGIGPALQRKLAALNILTFGDLAAADPETLTERLKGSQPISPAKVRAWTESARDLAQA